MPRAPLIVVVCILVGCGGGGSQEASPVFRRADAEKLVLRPSDLPRGCEYRDDSYCGTASAAEGEWSDLRRRP